MAVLRLEAFKLLAATIAAAVPGLELVLFQRQGGKKECTPNLAVTPVGKFRYEPDQEQEYFVPNASHVVLNVGRHEGAVQLRLAAASPTELAETQQQILDLFLGTEGHPGVLLTPVTACEALGKVLAAWELEDDEWDFGKAFDNRFESVILLTGLIPALVTRPGVYAIEHLQLGLTGDFATPFTPSTFTGLDVVEVQQDGSFVPVP